MLLAQLQEEEQAALQTSPDPTAAVLRGVYYPRKLYTRIARFYRWPWQAIDQLDYVAFFGCIEDAREMQDEEERAYKNGKGNDVITEQEAAAWLPVTRAYDGPTIDVR